MKLFVASLLIACVVADRLENTYLPPNSAKTAGGNGNFLNTPFGGRTGAPLPQYGAPSAKSGNYRAPSGPSNPSAQYGAPSSNYGAPNAAGRFGGNNNNAFSQSPDANAATLRFDNENNGDGSYRFEFETDNKISQQESGELRNIGTEQEGSVVQGTYSYMGPDGVMYTVNYIADENGFRATGDHIPTPPPVPEAIQRSLDKIAAEGNQQGYPNSQQGYQSGSGYQQNGGNGYQNGGNGYQNNASGYQNRGYQNGNAKQSQSQATNRQYLAPNKPTFNQQSGYQY